MFGLSSLIKEVGSTGMFNFVEPCDFRAISKDHLGDF
jgi:hypothetical protein